MTKKNKMSIDFKNFEEYAEKLEALGGDLKATAEEALKVTHEYITPNLKRDIAKHRKSGKTERSLIEKAEVTWEGTVASCPIGFDLANGGLASLFLMYGTPKHAPANQYGRYSGEVAGIEKGEELYNDIYGPRTKREVKKLQEEVFAKAIKKRMGG